MMLTLSRLRRLAAPRPGRRLFPSLEIMVLGLAAGLVFATAVAISANVASHLEKAATDEAVSSMKAVVHAYVDPLLSMDLLGAPDAATAASVNGELEKLVSSGQILRIKVWAPNGTILFSDLPALRGRSFEVDEDLGDALKGEPTTGVSSASAAENIFERGLAPRLLEIYLPIIDKAGAKPVGAYEIYQDATELEAVIVATRREVFLISGGIGLVLLLALYASFRGANRLLRELTARLRSREARFRSLVQNSSDLILLLDQGGVVTYVSPAIEQILGLHANDWVGRNATTLVLNDDAVWLQAVLDRLLSGGSATADVALRVMHGDGRSRRLEIVGTNLLADPEVRAVVLNCRDVTERHALEEQLRHQAFHDPLTNLANRPLLADRIEHELQALPLADRGLMAVMLLDLDDFKVVNDSLGRAAGDRLLMAFADRLRASLRAQDTAARIGGDEFAMLLQGHDRAEIELVGERVLQAMVAPIDIGEKRLTVSASLGIAFADGSDITAEELLRGADVAMHMAKASGKGRSLVYEPSMHAAAVRRLQMRADLERALTDGQLSLRYQPIVELASSDPIGVEALLRWEHPDGLIMPNDFIPVAEETGLIISIGHWVLETACRWMASRPTGLSHPSLRLGVNVSSVQLERPEFVAEVEEVLRITGFDAALLTLELTESVLVDRSGAAIAVMRRLRELGVRLAIDDFGTGYSSLSYLRDLPIDVLKIDRAFVAALEEGSGAPAVVRSIIHLAGTLGMTTVAEGIERPAQVARLRSLGAQYGQGFYFGEALTAEELTGYLSDDGGNAISAAG